MSTVERKQRRVQSWLFSLLPLVLVLVLYGPALRFELMGDDYQWWQHAHAAMHRPALLLADLDGFYRPANTWTLVADRLGSGDSPAGFHLTNLLLHGMAGVLLVLAGRRLRLPIPEMVLVGVLWALSPFSEEPAVSVAIRFQDLLFIAWLGLILAWPRAGGWSRPRMAVIVALTLLAAASKETWVVTPALAFALGAAIEQVRFPACLRRSAPFVLAAAVYTAIYFIVFPGDKGYFDPGFAAVSKLPHQLAAFLHLEQLVPLAFPFGWKDVLAITLVTGLVIWGWRRRQPAAMVGSTLLLAPMLPTLMVPFLPTRYTSIPYAGFLLLVASWVAHARRDPAAHPLRRRGTTGAALALAILVLMAGWFTVRADLVDYARVSSAHGMLVAEARCIAPEIPLHAPFLVVRGEDDDPLTTIALDPRGLPKIYFPRHPDPSGLIDAAALFEWAVHHEDTRFESMRPAALGGVAGAVIVHGHHGFLVVNRHVPDLAEAAGAWRKAGFRLRAVRPVPLGPRPGGS